MKCVLPCGSLWGVIQTRSYLINRLEWASRASATLSEEGFVPINFGKLAPPKTTKRPTDPLEIFRGLRVTDRAINDLWLAQGDALRTWDKERYVKDTAIVLNTGAGQDARRTASRPVVG